MANRDDIKKLIAYLALTFANFHPDVTSTPNTVDVWEDLLGDIEADKLQAGLRIVCKTPREFAPPPGVIRAAVEGLPVHNDPMLTLTKYLEDKKCPPQLN